MLRSTCRNYFVFGRGLLLLLWWWWWWWWWWWLGGILELPSLSLSLSRCSSRAAVVFLNGCATFGYCGFKFFSWILHVGYVFVGVVGHVIINFTFTFISIFLLVNRFIVCLFFFSFHCLFFLVLFLLPPPPLPVERERERERTQNFINQGLRF